MFTAPKAQKLYDWYYEHDPAFDRDSDAWHYKAWLDTGDEAHLPRTSPDVSPVKFVLRQLTHLERDAITDAGQQRGNASAMALMVAFALDSIDPFVLDGKRTDLEFTLDRTTKLRRVSDDHIAIIRGVDDGGLYAGLVARVVREEYASPEL